jgi:hypothetical protein
MSELPQPPTADERQGPSQVIQPEPVASGDDQSAGAVESQTVDEGFLPSRPERLGSESVLVRLVATIGVVAIGTALGAILVANDIAGWITGLAVSAVSVALAAVLWRSRRL